MKVYHFPMYSYPISFQTALVDVLCPFPYTVVVIRVFFQKRDNFQIHLYGSAKHQNPVILDKIKIKV